MHCSAVKVAKVEREGTYRLYRVMELVRLWTMDLQMNLSVHLQETREKRVLREVWDLQEHTVHFVGTHAVRRLT